MGRFSSGFSGWFGVGFNVGVVGLWVGLVGGLLIVFNRSILDEFNGGLVGRF